MRKKLIDIADKLIEMDSIDSDRKKRVIIIRKLLSDKNCFFHIDIDTAHAMLIDLGFSTDEAVSIYKELVDSKYYK